MEVTLATMIVIAIVVFGAFEFYLIWQGKPTISSMIRKWFSHYPPLGMLVGLIVGLLLGHFFWQ